MTSNNIKKLQILAITDDEEDKYLMAVTEDEMLIRVIAEFCQFAKLKNELFEQCSLKELIKKEE